MSIINGGSNNDSINGTFSNDTLNGGGGSDTVNGGFGNDTLIYNLADNGGANDRYSGGSGTDTLRIELTQAEWTSAQVQSEMTRYSDFRAGLFNNLPIFSDLFPSTFTFNFGNGTTLSISSIETVDVRVDGQSINLDVPVIATHNAGGTVHEDGNTDASPATSQSTSGTISYFDFDQGDNHTVTVAAPAGASGTLTASITNTARDDGQGAVSWTYNLNNAAVQSLAAGQERIEYFTVRVADANNAGQFAETQVRIAIVGTNDGPTVSGPLTSTAIEGGAAYALNMLSGANDIDQGEASTLSVSDVMYAIDGGTASSTPPQGLDRQGSTLSVNPADAAFNDLAVGQQRTITVSYNVTDAQGASITQTQTVTITGTNDAPTVASVLSASTTEGDAAFTLNLLEGADDVDQGEAAGLSIAGIRYAIDGGDVTTDMPQGLSLVGSVLTVDPTHPAFASLNTGETRAIVVQYDISDGQGGLTPQTQTIHIAGVSPAVNQAPVINAETGGTLSALPGQDWSLTDAIGSAISISDADNDFHTVTVTAANGTVSISHTDGITIQDGGSGMNQGTLAMSGSTADINAALATLSYRSEPDYEGQSTVTISAYDGDIETVRVIDFNVYQPYAPEAIYLATGDFQASDGIPTSEIGTVGASDRNGDVLTYTLVEQVDVIGGGATFSIAEDNRLVFDTLGNLSVVNAYEVTIAATDPGGLSTEAAFGIVVGTTGGDVLAGVSEFSNDIIYTRSAEAGQLDVVYAGNGRDSVFGGAGAEEMHGGADLDQLFGEGGNDTLYGDDGNDQLEGDEGDDVLHGGQGGDFLYGGTGDDVLHGGEGRDVLRGDLGNDVLRGGAGSDYLLGQDGADVFLFDTVPPYDPRVGFQPEGYLRIGEADAIDFNPDEGDVLQLSASAFQSLTQGTLDASNLVIGGADVQALDADDFIVYDNRGIFYYDADGAGGAEKVLFAVIVDDANGNRPSFELKTSDILIVA